MDILKNLTELGFTDYESKVYMALINRDLQSANEITKSTGVPRGRIYDILNGLLEKGFCIMVPGTIKKFKAIDPSISFEKLFTELKEKENKLKKTIDEVREQYNSIDISASPVDCIDVYTSRQVMVRKNFEIAQTTKKINRSFNKKPYLTTRNAEELTDKCSPVFESLKRGVIYQAIYEIELENIDNFLHCCYQFHNAGEIIRVIDRLPFKLIIKDDTTVMFTLRHKSMSENNMTAMVIEHSDITFALIDLFNYYWQQAIPFSEYLKQLGKKNFDQ